MVFSCCVVGIVCIVARTHGVSISCGVEVLAFIQPQYHDACLRLGRICLCISEGSCDGEGRLGLGRGWIESL